MLRRFHCLSILLVGAALSQPALRAQSTFGTILGTVTDNSGAVVSHARVKATNTDENTSRDALTNTNGDYEFVNTRAGHYPATTRSK
jgi:hypothetical protein